MVAVSRGNCAKALRAVFRRTVPRRVHRRHRRREMHSCFVPKRNSLRARRGARVRTRCRSDDELQGGDYKDVYIDALIRPLARQLGWGE